MKKIIKIIVALIILVIIGCTGFKVYQSYVPEEHQLAFKTENVKRADIMRAISATGTVEPEELVNVGAQVSGKIMSFGKDVSGNTMDFSSKVKKGMLLALIDDVTYKAELQEVNAEKAEAEASVKSAKASISEAKAQKIQAANDWKRAQTLYDQASMTKSDYDSYEAAFYSAKAEVAVAEAALAKAEASLLSIEASLVKARRNLEYCTISSPIDGVIIDRRVSIGQTVVSSQSASSIFLVAKDFKKMQVWVSVNEADIGSIYKGMPVKFFCDAFPNSEFRGKVKRLRLNATLSSNVVTFIVEVDVDNKDLKLIPYLTANVKFIKDERINVLAVSNSALRYSPSEDMVTPEGQSALAAQTAPKEAYLWVKTGNDKLRPIKVKVGLNNGLISEITTDQLNEGDSVVTGVEYVAVAAPGGDQKGDDSMSNPFLPKFPKHKKRGSAGKRERQQQRTNGGGAPPKK